MAALCCGFLGGTFFYYGAARITFLGKGGHYQLSPRALISHKHVCGFWSGPIPSGRSDFHSSLDRGLEAHGRAEPYLGFFCWGAEGAARVAKASIGGAKPRGDLGGLPQKMLKSYALRGVSRHLRSWKTYPQKSYVVIKKQFTEPCHKGS
jgi:hypothetical protein